MKALLYPTILLALAIPAAADVTLPKLFADGMVLQRGMPLPVWGTATPGEKVTVTGPTGSKTATADANGNWLVKLETLKLGPAFDLTVTGNNTITLKDVQAGDVWLAAGQSNMEWGMAWTRDGKAGLADIKAAPYKLFQVQHQASPEPNATIIGEWLIPEKQGQFSGTGFFFARELRQKTNVPIAMIGSYWGGTTGQVWTDRATVEADPAFALLVKEWRTKQAEYPAEYEKLKNEKLPAWEAAVAKAKAEGKTAPDRPYLPNPNGPAGVGYLWNGMIKPLIPFGIKGVIWYQGETNSDPRGYARLFQTLITDWRKQWGQGDFPFYFVQLANNGRKLQTDPAEVGWDYWLEVRESQAKALSLPNTGMAVTTDLADDPGNPGDTHYLNKTDVGKRLAAWALAKDYGQPVPYLSPLFESFSIEGPSIRVRFKGTESGLISKDGGPLKGFAIRGADKKWFWADAKIDGNSVILSNPEVPQPVAARYNWANNPIGNLYNAANLPAAPFRTDEP